MDPKEREVLIRMWTAHLVVIKSLLKTLENKGVLDSTDAELLCAECVKGTLFQEALKSTAEYYNSLCEEAGLKIRIQIV